MRIAVLVLALVHLAACAHDEPAPMRVDPEGFDAAWRDFEQAWDELEVAVRSTPRWKTDPQMTERVTGMTDIALDRVGRLALWDGSGLVSMPVVQLIEAEVRHLAGIDSHDLPVSGASIVVEPEIQNQRFREERAWHRVDSRLALLERYVAEGVPSPWLERRALPHDLAALDQIAALDFQATESWARLRVSENDFDDVQARGAAVAIGLRGELEAR